MLLLQSPKIEHIDAQNVFDGSEDTGIKMSLLMQILSKEEVKMQADELQEPASTADEANPANMTFKDPEIPDFSQESCTVSPSFDTFEGINLEDDIEKVEVSSPCSSETNDEDYAEDYPSRTPNSNQGNIPEDFKSWLQRISEMQTDINKTLINTSSPTPKEPETLTKQTTNSASRIVKYQDLPYMGEMTLENSKPRRGRKPKKADICHLIYKNYGTIFPGTPNPDSYLEHSAPKKTSQGDASNSDNLKRSDVQTRIISSLLEKRLTQENHRRCDDNPNQQEPLNLCIRDLNHLKIRLFDKEELIKSELHSDEDVEFVNDGEALAKVQQFSSSTPESSSTLSPDVAKGNDNGYVFWPNAGVFLNPMALQQQLLYYQKLAATNNFVPPVGNTKLPLHIPPSGKDSSQELRKLIPKVKTKRIESSEETESNSGEVKTKRNLPTEKMPTKRKRSAIFIPPIPAENNSNPATEVSICKFKFTGGAKPSLQEKKMLSVDSGGNFRYYSGTGDKSMRGYEFFPRETLQQQASCTQGSSTGAFLQASGEKIFPCSSGDANESKVKSEFLLTPELPPTTVRPIQDLVQKHKKRKSRKSLQREKLEQTFKEKGFLIQTQQLESAEGATYCKFRQLRKFTRYLFRSWKDYLPGNVNEVPEQEKRGNEDISEQDMDNLSSHSNGV